MKNKYEVIVTDTFTKSYYVQAESYEDAENIVNTGRGYTPYDSTEDYDDCHREITNIECVYEDN